MSGDPILAAVDARIAALQQLRAHIVEVLALTSMPLGETPAPRDETKPARRATPRRHRETSAAEGETSRPLRASQGTAAGILLALKDGKPHAAAAIAASIGMTSAGVLYQIKKLVAVGQVIREGASNATRYRLA